jgi:glycosyltransferase involved in cell wall biosynthesis
LTEANVVLQLSERALLVVSMGQGSDESERQRLVSAWPAVLRRWPHARLWLAGELSNREGLLEQIESLGLTGRVASVGAFDEVDALLAAADLLVAPESDGSPFALLEAMAAGLPVVAADVPQNRWLVGDEVEGLLIPPGDVDALSAAVTRILDQPRLAARLGSAGRERVASEFPLDKMVDGSLTLLDRLTTARASSP